MAKVIFEFDVCEDAELLKLYQAVNRMYFALDEIYNTARNELKHGNEHLSDHIDDLLESIKIRASLVHELDGN